MTQETRLEIKPDSTVTVESSTADANGDGIPDILQTVLGSADFKNDWSNRRRLIFWVMGVIGVTIVAIIGCLCWLLLNRGGGDLEHVLDSVDSYLYASGFVAVSIIGSYVFGSHFGAASLRGSVVDIVKTVSGRRR